MSNQEVPSRAREESLDDVLINGTASDYVVLTSSLKRRVNRWEWRRLRQRRASFVSALLRALRRALGPHYSHRVREQRTWRVFAHAGGEALEAVRFDVPAQHKVKDFKQPLDVVVLRPDLMNQAQLSEWAALIRTGPVWRRAKK